MSVIALVLAGLAIGVLGFFAGVFFGGLASRKRLSDGEAHYEALKRDFDTISAVNLQLLRRNTPKAPDQGDENTMQRFMDLYDDAKRCLHRTLDRHNATAPRPIVIARDGGNILDALNELPECSFSATLGEDAGVRSWLHRVFELDLDRRKARRAPRQDDVLALEGERALWGAALKQGARV